MQFTQLYNQNLPHVTVTILLCLPSLPFTNSLLIRVSIWLTMGPGILLPLYGFSTFYVRLLFTHTLVQVYIWSNPHSFVYKFVFRAGPNMYIKGRSKKEKWGWRFLGTTLSNAVHELTFYKGFPWMVISWDVEETRRNWFFLSASFYFPINLSPAM